MEKVVKCLLLKNNQVIVTEIVEIGSELGEPDCKLINPVIMDQSSGDLYTWLDFTDQKELMIHSDSIFTIVDPNKEVIIKYLELTA